MTEPDEQRLFTEAGPHGLRARLCDGVDVPRTDFRIILATV